MEMVIEGKDMERQPVEVLAMQVSPVWQIVFAIYTARLITRVEKVGADGLSRLDNIRWIATGKDVHKNDRKLRECSSETLKWADS